MANKVFHDDWITLSPSTATDPYIHIKNTHLFHTTHASSPSHAMTTPLPEVVMDMQEKAMNGAPHDLPPSKHEDEEIDVFKVCGECIGAMFPPNVNLWCRNRLKQMSKGVRNLNARVKSNILELIY